MDRLDTFRTFLAGALVGAGAVYFSPAASPGPTQAPVTLPGTPPTPQGEAAALPPVPPPSPPPEVPPPAPAPVATAPTPSETGARLERHLRDSGELWKGLLARARGGGPAAVALVPEIEAHAAQLPAITAHLPPMQAVAAYLVNSRGLLTRMSAAGLDVRAASDEIDVLLHPTRPRSPG